MTAVDPSPPLMRATWLQDSSLTHDLIALRSTVAEVLLTRTEHVVVDVSELGRPSSSAIAALLWAKRSCTRGGVDFCLRGAGHDNRDILLRCGLLTATDATDLP